MNALFRFMDWPLRTKMAALLVVASLLPLAIAAFIDIRQAQDRLLANTAALLAARDDELQGEFDAFNRSYQLSVTKLARLPDVVEFSQARPDKVDRLKPSVRAILEIHASSDTNLRGLAVLDLSGTVKIATEDRLVGKNLSYHGYVREALQGAAVISDIHLAEPEVGYIPTIAYLAPVPGPDTKIIGLAVLWVRAKSLWDIAKESNELAGPRSFAVVFDRLGIRVAHTYSDDIVFHPGGALSPIAVDALVAERRFGEKTRALLEDVRAFPEQFDRARSELPDRGLFHGFAPVNQTMNYGVARRLNTVPWTIFYMIPEESLNAQIAQTTRDKTVFAGVIILIALVTGMSFAVVILGPIRSLSKATESIARGDLAVRVQVGRADELGRLGTSFNSMAQQTESQAAALQKAHDELELRVAERTTELAQLAAIVESSDDAIMGKTLDGVITSWNSGAERMFGYSRKEALRNPMLLIFPPDRRNEESHIIARIAQGKNIDHFETVRVRKDGKRIDVSVTISPIKDRSGRIVGASTIAQDITARKQAQEALRASEVHLRSFVDQAPASMAMFDVNMICLAASHRWVAAYGRGQHDLVGLSHYEVHPDMPEGWREIHRKGLAGEAQKCDEELWIQADGTRNWLRWAVQPWRDVHGDIGGIMILAEDITEHKRIEEEIRETKNFLASIFDNIPNSIFVKDATDLRFVRVNPACEKLTGYAEKEFLGKNDYDFFPKDQADFFVAKDRETLAGKQRVFIVEESITSKDGTQKILQTKKFPMLDKDGHPQYLLGMSEDITERKRTDQALVAERTLLRTLIDALPDVVFTKDAVGRFTMCNVAAFRHSGLVRESEILGKSVFDFYSRDMADNYHADDLRTLSGNPVLNREEISVDAAGVQRWFLTNKVPLRESSGNIIGMVGISRDITERKQAEQQIRESESKYRALIEQASDGIFVSDAEGNFVMVNTRGCQLLGYASDELIGLNGKVTYLEEETAIHTQRMNAVVAGEDLRYERMVKRKDGSAFPAEISLKMLDAGMVQVIFHDITARRSQERRIARLSRIQQVLSGINSAIVRIRDRQELFEEACRIAVEHGGFSIVWLAMLDQESGTLVSVAQAGTHMDFSPGVDSSNRRIGLVPGATAEIALREKGPAFDNDIENNPGFLSSAMGPDTMGVRREAIRLGAKSVIVLPLFVEGQTFGILTLYAPERNFFDDAELKLLTELAGDVSFALTFIAQQEKVEYLAYYDPLTGLPNRSLFFDRLGHQLGAAKRDRTGLALILIDLDRFRLINDTLGRQAGDALLEAVAKRLKDAVRDQDSAARVGSNRFAVGVTGVSNSDEAARALEKRSEALFGKPFVLGREELRVLATAGVAMFPGDGSDPESLFANAEAALRKAKAENLRFLFYSPEMNARVADSLRLENKLRRALENDELVLWYQPKVDAKTRKLTGFEALMRWQDPETGMVPPAKFIPLMEQTGLILDAGRWALLQVARDCRLWVANGVKAPRIAVNVSPIQLRQKEFVATIIEAAEKAEEVGASLDLEITESVIMENVERIIPILQTVRGLGVEIAIDDFGTGYSSLAYVARLPIQALKIDRSFVVGMTQSEDSLAIVRSVISLAHSLRLHVIAEGVETEEQAALLLRLKCDEMQGYLFSRPVPPEDVPEFLRRPTHSAPTNPPREISATTKSSRNGKKKAKRGSG